jgi:hypothetical protein
LQTEGEVAVLKGLGKRMDLLSLIRDTSRDLLLDLISEVRTPGKNGHFLSYQKYKSQHITKGLPNSKKMYAPSGWIFTLSYPKSTARYFYGTFAFEICFSGIYFFRIYIYGIYFYRALL